MDALENLASIDAHLTIGVRYVGTVAHETATLDILSSNIHRRNRTARRRRIEVLQAAEKDRISINQQRLNATPNKALECHVNVALAVGVSHNEFKPECTRRGMQLRHNSLDVGISGIDEEADYSCGGDEFAQHLKPFRRERHLHKADAGDIAARSVEALNKTKADRVGALWNTMGIVEVAFRAAAKGAAPPTVTIRVTCRLTKSAASAGSLSSWPSAQRNSIARLRPSINSASLNPRRIADTFSA